MAELEKSAVEKEQEDFSAAFADLATNLKEPGAAASAATAAAATETSEAKAAREAAATAVTAATAAAATETSEAKSAREAAATAATAAAAAAATETSEAKAAREAAAPAAAATETPEAKAVREATAAAAIAAAAAAAAATPAIQPTVAELTKQLADANAEAERLRTAAPVKPAEKVDDKPLYNAEEQVVLDKYVAEWDVVKKGEELIRRSEYRQLVGYIFEQVQNVYGPALQYLEARSGKDQYSDIKQLVSDYDQVRDPTIAWVKQQPTFLKTAYEKVISEGTPEDVRDLIQIFKKATGVATTAAVAPVAGTATAGIAAGGMAAAAPANPQAAAALAALKPVDSGRTVQPAGADPNDFNAAFSEFAGLK